VRLQHQEAPRQAEVAGESGTLGAGGLLHHLDEHLLAGLEQFGDAGTALLQAQGAEIGTVEGVSTGTGLHPIQQKFLEHAALQCGVCTPGLIVATRSLLLKHPNPTEAEARYYLAGNLCRCTGYDKIIRAVLDAAASMRGESA